MRLASLIRLARLLRQLALRSLGRRPPSVIEDRDLTASSGMSYDRYRPRGRTRRRVIALHGMTPNGNHDRRLVHFARSLATIGTECMVPKIPGLARCRWEKSDVDLLTELATSEGRGGPARVDDRAAAMLPRATIDGVGMVGFSFGASYALLAAARPGARDHVRFVLGFGPHWSLGRMLDHYEALLCGPPPVTPQEWEETTYLRLVLASGSRPMPPDLRALAPEIDSLLLRYCEEASLDEKRTFHQRYLTTLDVPKLGRAWVDPGDCDALSPADKLADVRCPIFLVHGEDDGLVPAECSRLLAAEKRDIRLLVTPLLSHVKWRQVLDLPGIVRLLGMLGPLVE